MGDGGGMARPRGRLVRLATGVATSATIDAGSVAAAAPAAAQLTRWERGRPGSRLVVGWGKGSVLPLTADPSQEPRLAEKGRRVR